jgi:Zn-dependent protease with chaperone function
MQRLLSIAVTGFAALMSAGRPVPAAPAEARVQEIADVSLRDVAVAVYDPVRPVIYFNPDLMDRFSPELGAFFMAHEYAHIALRHTRASALRAEVGNPSQVLQGKELEADCLAAKRLGSAHRDASLAAVRFFSRMGNTQFDTEHPTGTQRARRILACMPE